MNVKHLFINLTDPVIFQSFGGEGFWSKVSAPAGTVIFKEGEDSQDFYYVFSGNLFVDKSLKDQAGAQKRIATLGTGDFFGEGALLSDKTRAATVTAQSDSVLLKLSQKNFESLVASDPHAAVGIILGILKVLNARFQDTNERLVVLQQVAKLVRESSGSADLALRSIVMQLQSVIHHGKAVLAGVDGMWKAASEGLSAEEVALIQAATPRVFPLLSTVGAPESYADASHLYTAVHAVDGKLIGALVIPVCADCMEQDARLVLTVAEQIGHLM
ncbi:cyclic nucleotide-binding domain-containing protein [Candidatus Peregrinibacteria bacterium]|nr:MAG: cyclic nucleotide-binding domain-containing protein [Candidatus Peregrinibacteria bacterium]